MYFVLLASSVLVPGVVSVFWWRRHGIGWSSWMLGVAAYAVKGLVLFPGHWVAVLGSGFEGWVWRSWPVFFISIPTRWIFMVTLNALVREGVRCLILATVGVRVKTWREGVLFGLGYGSVAGMGHFGLVVETLSGFLAQDGETVISMIGVMRGWDGVWEGLNTFLTWNLAYLPFNVGTCLFCLWCVRRRNLWYYGAAVLWYVLMVEVPKALYGRENLFEFFRGYGNNVVNFEVMVVMVLVGVLPLMVMALRGNDEGTIL